MKTRAVSIPICIAILTIAVMCTSYVAPDAPRFEIVQQEIFSTPGTYTNAWADYDNDGDFDLFIGFKHGSPNRLYRNDNGVFTDVAGEAGVADIENTRGAAWSDFDGDGFVDLYVSFTPPSTAPGKLYRNDGSGHFSDTAPEMDVELVGNFRQISWIDYDNDGDVDLFVAVRDKPNILLRNDGDKFTNVSRDMSVDDPRRTVGAVWFDFDQDGDLDLFTTNQNGDRNGIHRNDGTHFIDIAPGLGYDTGGRPLQYQYGSIRPSLGDFDNDGDLDIFVANYGPNALFRNDGGGRFVDVAPEMGLAIDSRYDAGEWADVDHDGLPDLYVNGTIGRDYSNRDYLFHNDGGTFTEVTPPNVLELEADHGIQWVDFDRDGDLDLSLTGSGENGMHYVLRNLLEPEKAKRSLQVMVLDGNGCYTRPGSEVRLIDASSGKILGTRIFDTGSGYNSQSAVPVHFGLADSVNVDVEITVFTKSGRTTVVVPDVDPRDYSGSFLTVKIDAEGKIVR